MPGQITFESSQSTSLEVLKQNMAPLFRDLTSVSQQHSPSLSPFTAPVAGLVWDKG